MNTITMLSNDQFRPDMHFTPAFGWMNDPNGLVYINNEYHLFYQYYPFGTKWGPMHWGHATSIDLIHWTHLPPALLPDEMGMCFSGSAVIDSQNTSGLFNQTSRSNVVAFYTACLQPEGATSGVQSQAMASSLDGGLTWQKYANNPILPNPNIPDFRDPKVIWYESGQYWVMVITLGQSVGFYRSEDMASWVKTGEFGAAEGAHDEQPWECPDLFPIQLEGTDEFYWILIVGVQNGSHAGGSGTQYFIGQFDGMTFHNCNPQETILWLDFGRDYYAAQTWSDTLDNKRLSIAWMSNWQYANEVPTVQWRSAMSAPRELTLVNVNGKLRLQSKLPTLWQLEVKTPLVIHLRELPIEQTLELMQQYHSGILMFDLELNENSSIRFNPFGNESVSYLVHRTDQSITVKTNRQVNVVGEDKYQETFGYESEIVFEHEGKLSCNIIIDRCSCELFLADGIICLTDLAFTDLDKSFNFQSVEGRGVLSNVKFYSSTCLS